MNPLSPSPTPGAQDPLSQLRDIHLPEAVGLWPPAPGWWLLGILALVAAAVGTYLFLSHRRRNRYRRLALAELAATQQQALHTTTDLQQINQLLKRTLLAAPHSPPAAGLSGKHWLAFLDASGDTMAFSSGPGQLLAELPYSPRNLSPEEKQQLPQLVKAVRRWILTHQFRGRELPC